MDRRVLHVAIALAVALGVAGCGGDDGDDASGGGAATTTTAASTTSSSEATAPLSVMLTNDDGVGAPGIDALAVALRDLPGVTVTIVAPADQQSGSGGKTTPGTLASHPATTASGLDATAVEGYPADTVIWAVDQGGLPAKPQLVVSGSNAGQNLGPVADISGTIGAARAAASRGIPALAVSQGVGTSIDYSTSVSFAVAWVRDHRDAIASGSAPAAVTNINSPTCGQGAVKGIEEVPAATDAADRNVIASDVDCSTATGVGADDVDTFNAGYATQSDVPVAA
jgi:5'-nucleotidase